MTKTFPLESSEEAAEAIEATLREYNYPANAHNAARAGWRAARLKAVGDIAALETALKAAQEFILRAYNWDSDGPGKYPTLQTIAKALGEPRQNFLDGDHDTSGMTAYPELPES